MSRLEKDMERLKSKPKDFTYDEAKSLLNRLGFIEYNKGKTSGSRVTFENLEIGKKFDLHKPHPKNILKQYMVNKLIKSLEEWRMI